LALFQEVTMKRQAIQNAMDPVVKAAIDEAVKKLGIDVTDRDHARRVFRAVVGLAASRLLDLNAPPQLVASEALRAVVQEVEARANTAVAQGNPFGLPPPASA